MKLYQTLEQHLKQEPNYVTDNGELKKWVVLNKAQNFDEELIGLLLSNAELKAKFFVSVKDALVFNQNLFVQFLEQKNYLNDSYTQYKNKVGLTIDGKYLKQRNEVALVWPFKDCILEGGQSSEEEKREEIFFNEVLAQDEITQLLESKVLTNAKRIDKAGEKQLDQFNRDQEGTITDNLIIKGNNLLAMHTLKQEFTGKIKLIYIDPPYNTDSDSFQYNDSFNHSTWLTFIKNRLNVAKELLNKEGVIFVQCDYIEHAYLKVLMDEVFGVEKSLPVITVKTSTPAGFKVVNPGLVNVAEHILVYCMGDKKTAIKKAYVKAGYQSDYKYVLSDRNLPVDQWTFSNIKQIALSLLPENAPKSLIDAEIADFAQKNHDRVFATYGPHKPSASMSIGIAESKTHPEKIKSIKRDDGGEHYLLNGRLIAFYTSKLKEVDGEICPTQRLTDFWGDISWDSISNEGGVTLNNGKKPEKLLKRIIEISTEPNDLVLDFHLGSGTTAAVAHKTGRRYIGIEQLDYGKNDSVIRMKNVLNGESSGISKSVNWQGGGDFVYLELKKYNQTFIEQIDSTQDSETLLGIWEQMKAKSFLNYNVDIKKQDAHIGEFKALSLEQQKQHLCELLDKNQLYVNLSSLSDADFACTEAEIAATKDFYRIKN